MNDDERTAPSTGTPARMPLSRYQSVAAIVIMIATFVLIQPTFAITIVAAAWLVGTRVTSTRRMLGLSLTEALAWSATIFIFDFLAALLVFIAGGNLGQ
jgi:hypothetical protein